MKHVLTTWNKRHLTPLGKRTTIKTLAVSKNIHLLLTLTDPPAASLRELNTALYTWYPYTI